MKPLLIFALAGAAFGGSPTDVLAQTAASDGTGLELLQKQLDFIWVLVAAALVFLMQIGFLLLEAGMVRSKNSINVAQKNFLDFMASSLVFGAIGFMIAFGASAAWGPVGTDSKLFMLSELDPWLAAFFVFQVMFCGTAATIVSGAVAERMKLSSYVICAIVIGGLIYPVFTHWAWGAALGANSGAFLGNMGFVDFAGSTVVHATGAWIGLAACLVLGSRLGRFGPNGEVRRMTGHNPVLAAAGALLLFVGWIGFNGGSTVAANTDVAHIILNTVMAGAAGGMVGYLLGLLQDGVSLPDKPINGCLAGLVAVTAGCMVLDVKGAVAIGAIGAVAALMGNVLLEKLKVDDAVGAIGVHGFAGVTGTLGLAILAPLAHLPAGDRLAQLQIQGLGAGVNFLWAFGIGYAFFYVLNKLMRIRIDAEAEERGLNEAEHGTRLGIGHVEEAFGKLASGSADLEMRLPVEPGDEAEQLTKVFNSLMENLQQEESEREAFLESRRSDQEAERLSALANTTFEALCICVDSEIIDGNAPFADIIGETVERLTGRRLTDFMAAEHHDAIQNVHDAGESVVSELLLIDLRGEHIPVSVRSREIVYRGVATRVLAMLDLRERKETEAKIRHVAQHDPLTGLPNRALFNETLDRMTARTVRENILSAVMIVDLDRFKDINDLHGHQAGDEVIKVAAERLRNAIRPCDMVARLGGDEFGILQIDIDFVNQSADLAHRIAQELSRPIALPDGAEVRAGASIGVAICPRDGMEGLCLMSRADTALYHAKNAGRNTFSIFEDGMDREVRRRQMLEADLSLALERDEFQLYCQPRMSAKNGEISSYEALIRWNHPEKGMISPNDFISVAEQSGRIVSIGDWVLRTACEIAMEQLHGCSISINVSPLQLREPRFVEKVAAALAESGLPASRLEIEITEGILIDDDKRATALLKGLKKLGVQIALDDFGTGYSSLSYLSRFPFDTIKIDRSFVTGIHRNENSRAIVETIIRLGQSLHMRVVAEGVEEIEELRCLAQTGCDEIQGYLVGRPQPVKLLIRAAPAEVMAALDMRNAAIRPLERAMLDLQRRVEGLGQSVPSGATHHKPERQDVAKAS